jgi:hypothetical protein
VKLQQPPQHQELDQVLHLNKEVELPLVQELELLQDMIQHNPHQLLTQSVRLLHQVEIREFLLMLGEQGLELPLDRKLLMDLDQEPTFHLALALIPQLEVEALLVPQLKHLNLLVLPLQLLQVEQLKMPMMQLQVVLVQV